MFVSQTELQEASPHPVVRARRRLTVARRPPKPSSALPGIAQKQRLQHGRQLPGDVLVAAVSVGTRCATRARGVGLSRHEDHQLPHVARMAARDLSRRYQRLREILARRAHRMEIQLREQQRGAMSNPIEQARTRCLRCCWARPTWLGKCAS